MLDYPNAGITIGDTSDTATEKAQRWAASQPGKLTGPTSYQEWSLAGGKAGTGKTYAEWLETKGANIVKSGGLVIAESDIAVAQSQLDSSRGQDGYINTALYLKLLKAWKDDGGLEQDFYKQFSPMNYLNPNDPTIPAYIKEKLKTIKVDTFEEALNRLRGQ